MTNEAFHVTDAAGWHRLDDALAGFHDGVVRRAELTSGDFVDTDLSAVIEGRQAVSVLVQFQRQTAPAAALLFAEVRSLCIHGGRDVSPSEFVSTDGGYWRASFLSIEIEARQCAVHVLPVAYLGVL